jgi:hypothetical protein
VSDAQPKEPAIPVVAPVPLRSLVELLTQAEQDWPQSTQKGASVAFRVDAKGVAVVGTLTLHDDVDARVLASRTYDGHWEVSGAIRWSPRQ